MSVNIQLENKLKTIAGGKLTARQVTQALGYTPANASSVTNIIDVNELPTENINPRALYRITKDVYKVSTIDSSDQGMQLEATYLKVIAVDALPETGEDFNDFFVYYNTTEDNVYLYTEQTWLTSTSAGYPYLGCVSAYEEMTSTEGLYLIHEKQYHLYEYTDGRFIKILTEGNEKPPVIFRAVEKPTENLLTECCYFTQEEIDMINNNDDVIIRFLIDGFYYDFKRNIAQFEQGQEGYQFQSTASFFGTQLLILNVTPLEDGISRGGLVFRPIFHDLGIEINDQNQLELYDWPDLKETLSTMSLDITPTENSQRLVLSSGVYAALKDKANTSDVYIKTEVDNKITELDDTLYDMIIEKADKTALEPLQKSSSIVGFGVLGTMVLEGVLDAYTKEEIDEKDQQFNTSIISLQSDINQIKINVNSVTELVNDFNGDISNLYDIKADKENVYTKAEIDEKDQQLNAHITENEQNINKLNSQFFIGTRAEYETAYNNGAISVGTIIFITDEDIQ